MCLCLFLNATHISSHRYRTDPLTIIQDIIINFKVSPIEKVMCLSQIYHIYAVKYIICHAGWQKTKLCFVISESKTLCHHCKYCMKLVCWEINEMTTPFKIEAKNRDAILIWSSHSYITTHQVRQKFCDINQYGHVEVWCFLQSNLFSDFNITKNQRTYMGKVRLFTPSFKDIHIIMYI